MKREEARADPRRPTCDPAVHDGDTHVDGCSGCEWLRTFKVNEARREVDRLRAISDVAHGDYMRAEDVARALEAGPRELGYVCERCEGCPECVPGYIP